MRKLPYNGEIMVAIKKQDRDAIRKIMELRNKMQGYDKEAEKQKAKEAEKQKAKDSAMQRRKKEREVMKNLPYNGDIMLAMRRQDRDAIRQIMVARNKLQVRFCFPARQHVCTCPAIVWRVVIVVYCALTHTHCNMNLCFHFHRDMKKKSQQQRSGATLFVHTVRTTTSREKSAAKCASHR